MVELTSELAYYVNEWIFPAAFALLPAAWNSNEARAEMLAIGFQESEFNARQQGGKGTRPGTGPAKGMYQFERIGVAGVLASPVTAAIVRPICELLLYAPEPETIHEAIEHNDVLASVFARALLRIDPRALPTPIESQKGWSIYKANWRPGKPHPEKWPDNFREGWRIVKGA